MSFICNIVEVVSHTCFIPAQISNRKTYGLMSLMLCESFGTLSRRWVTRSVHGSRVCNRSLKHQTLPVSSIVITASAGTSIWSVRPYVNTLVMSYLY
jgi:hypothetical protein